ncbi:putative SUF system FeS cluster assembly, SufBD [Rosa chinensis]|uniref:Putative SUF system FeS cluster assembly, SufBD n=1 Tax=Rosa chinensis TaxID=74649 RepID=A0A2P6SBW2_ROSCH|nr:putative SUF system FeS cluster assembly, SufBD [Rosa chinensis]PRQ56173.1 putative SUF system FeS cluster assembly, SufBD [Rosa chinensis]
MEDSDIHNLKSETLHQQYELVKNPIARIEHEANTSKIGEDHQFYFQQRGIDYEKAMAAMISCFCQTVFNELPDEFGS